VAQGRGGEGPWRESEVKEQPRHHALIDEARTRDTEDSGAKEPAALLRPVLQLISLVVAPTTLLTALLYYFGWLSTNRFSRYFGIDPSTIGFSTQDYLLRAIAPAFGPLIVLAASGLLFVWIHRQISEWIHFGRHPKALQAIIHA